MRWLYIGIGVALTAAVMAACVAVICRRHPEENTDCIDGGVVKRHDDDMPKVIESTEIVSFHCEISLFAACETDGLGHRVYKLDAVRETDGVLVKYDWYDRQGGSDKAEYTTDADFMVRLQKIVSEYDFAQHNGYYHTVSGLPAMYGEKLDIVYASDESIYACDNQSRFLSLEAERALVELFGAATKLETE